MIIAERLEPARLSLLAADDDLRVRFVVAERCLTDLLIRLRDDPDPEVRRVARSRLGEDAES
jgi:hypothetical protein